MSANVCFESFKNQMKTVRMRAYVCVCDVGQAKCNFVFISYKVAEKKEIGLNGKLKMHLI